MSTHLLLEAALRSVVMGTIILAALRLLRIEQVRARRTAWLLALAGSLAMPALVAAQIGPRLLPEAAFAKLTAAAAPLPAAGPTTAAARTVDVSRALQSLDVNGGSSGEVLRTDDAQGAA
ncbi:MAG TPA: hypothetical protein VHW95_12190, partial [Steroidobacteraceae bacterium]|nr:hypothetical protein [Steroidobacteraceae bacterium]